MINDEEKIQHESEDDRGLNPEEQTNVEFEPRRIEYAQEAEEIERSMISSASKTQTERSKSHPTWGGVIVTALIFSLVFGGGGGFLGYWFAKNSISNGVAANTGSSNVIPVTKIGDKEYYDAVVDVANKVSKAVVSIYVDVLVVDKSFDIFGDPFNNPFNPFSGRDNSSQPTPPNTHLEEAAGSGVIIKNIWNEDQGYIITNNHVVENAQSIKVSLKDKRRFDAKVVATDPASDIAVLKISAKDLPTVELGKSSELKVGQTVIAIGNPYELENTVTVGVVSALARNIQVSQDDTRWGVIQTDAAINPGNSGGPLVTLDGKVVGINMMVNAEGQNLGFAVSSDIVSRVVQELLKYGKMAWPYLGIRGTTMTEEIAKKIEVPFTQGAFISQISAGPARQAGIESYDIITKFGDATITTFDDLLMEVRNHRVGDKVPVTVMRKGKEIKLTITLGELPSGLK